MAIKISTGLANSLLGSGAVRSVLEGASGMALDIFAGTRPDSPDSAPGSGATLLCTLTLAAGANGIHFETGTITGLKLTKKASEVWRGLIVTEGTATWYRLRQYGDNNALSTALPRVDGSVGTSGTDLTLTSVSMKVGAPVELGEYELAMPQSQV